MFWTKIPMIRPVGVILFFLAICLYWAPLVVVLISYLFIFLVVLVEISAFLLGARKKFEVNETEINEFPKISVHLAICNEPPSMVMFTIKAIVAQDYPSFELIVIDNNTKEESLWKPIESFCSQYENVRFFHLSNWPNYKSGALNFARRITSEESEYIFVVDADYILKSDALATAISKTDSSKFALIQFPQSYKRLAQRHIPLLEEFNHFFKYYCLSANSCFGVLATGTLSLIKVDPLTK